MTTLEKAARQALEALEDIGDEWGFTSKRNLPKRKVAINALRQALEQPAEQPAQEPVACVNGCQGFFKYSPPSKPWVSLTDEEFDFLVPYCENKFDLEDYKTFARAIEAKLKEKNT